MTRRWLIPALTLTTASCVAYAAKYYRGEPEPKDRLLGHQEIRVKSKDGKTDKRIGYLKKFEYRDVTHPKDPGYTYYRIYDDLFQIIGRVENDGSFLRYVFEGEYAYLNSWELVPGLKYFFGYGPATNLYLAPVDPYRD